MMTENELMTVPFFENSVPAGFPSPAEDYMGRRLNIHEYVVHNATASFLVKASGNSMINAGIFDGDIMVVDRSLQADDKSIVIATIDGNFTVKRLIFKNDWPYLYPENPEYEPIKIREEMDFSIWGVVTYVIHKAK